MLLTEAGLNRLLDVLDPDREIAGRKYQTIQRKLVTFFECRGCGGAEDLADKTIDRVIRRLVDGEQIRAKDPGVYFYGIARNIAHEWWNAQKEPARSFPQLAPEPAGDAEDEMEWRSRSLDECLETLPADARQLILDYYEDQGPQRIRSRRRLALQLSVSATALRIRAHRIREQLERCVRARLTRRRGDAS